MWDKESKKECRAISQLIFTQEKVEITACS
jgi:hypothetical protein